jgi:hypothetical protein
MNGGETMVLYTWNMFVAMLAVFVRENMKNIHRGTFKIRRSGEGTLALAAFGNEAYAADAAVQRDLDWIRKTLRSSGMEELGFGISPDGKTWAMVVQADDAQYQTAAGKAFHAEMLKELLDEIVLGAERAAQACSRPGMTWPSQAEQPAG